MWFSYTFLVTSFNNGTFNRALRKKGHIHLKLWEGESDNLNAPLFRRTWSRYIIWTKIKGKSTQNISENFRKKLTSQKNFNNLYKLKICEGILCVITFTCKQFLIFQRFILKVNKSRCFSKIIRKTEDIMQYASSE